MMSKNVERIIGFEQVFGPGVKLEQFFIGNAPRAVFVARVGEDLVAKHCLYSLDVVEFKDCSVVYTRKQFGLNSKVVWVQMWKKNDDEYSF